MDIKVTEQKSELALAYKEHATMENIVAVIDKGLNMTINHLMALGKQPAGAPYCCYTNGSEDLTEFDLELGFPVAEEVPVKDGMYMARTYGGKVVESMHKGAYDTLEETYTAMMRYVQENSLEMTGVYYDWYLNDPDNTPEDELLTKVVFPVR